MEVLMRGVLVSVFSLLLFVSVSLAGPPRLAFESAGPGHYGFDTGAVRGKIRTSGGSQGILELVHAASGVAVAQGGGLPGIFSYYRVFSTDTRYGDAVRDWPTKTRLLPDGALEVLWPPAEKHPVEITAVFRWRHPEVLDLQTVVRPQKEMPGFEVFLSSYFPAGFRALVYVKPNMFSRGKPEFLAADVNGLVDGSYLMFPRDRHAAQSVFDRRWEFPPNPVQWSVTRQLAAPMAMRRDDKSGVAAILMSPPEDCFAVATPYNKTPPDDVAAHQSLYLSLFGRDVRAGQTARADARLVVGRGLSDGEVVKLYEEYLRGRK
jgi:hypothetical protein